MEPGIQATRKSACTVSSYTRRRSPSDSRSVLQSCRTPSSVRTGQVRKVNCARDNPRMPLTRNDTYRNLLEQAHKIYSSKPYFKQELSRTKFTMSRLLSLQGDPEGAGTYKMEALRMYRSLSSSETRQDDELTIDDFDAIVTYASR